MERVLGFGGFFFKAGDPQSLAQWYATHFGVPLEPWGGARFRGAGENAAQGATGLSAAYRPPPCMDAFRRALPPCAKLAPIVHCDKSLTDS